MKREALIVGSAAVLGGVLAMIARNRNGGMDLHGKVVLITGGSKGLGYALARECGRAGARLAICARSQEELQTAKQALERTGTQVFTMVCDVGVRGQAENFVAQTVAHYGSLDVLINNAGVIQVSPLEALRIEDFEEAMDIMFWGAVYTSLAALPHLRRAHEGRIVNVTSVGAKVSVPHLLPYSCAKFAAAAFSEGLRSELSGTNVKVVTIAPGLMRTGSYLNARFKGNPEGEAAWFGPASSLPGLTIGASRAARQIMGAMRTGRAEKILTTQANLLALLHGVFPGLTSDLLGLVNRLLPKGADVAGEVGAESHVLRKQWMRRLMLPGERAAREFLQPARMG